MRPLPAFVALMLLMMPGVATAQDGTLSLSRPLKAGETASIEIEVGPLPQGATITVTTPTGEPLGRFAPFGLRAAQAGGTYTVPLPPGALRDGRVTVRLMVSVPGGPPRPATAQEVVEVKLVAPSYPQNRDP